MLAFKLKLNILDLDSGVQSYFMRTIIVTLNVVYFFFFNQF